MHDNIGDIVASYEPGLNFPFVLEILHRMSQSQIEVWLSGGWAEELWRISPPGPHQDIDLLYPAFTFAKLDQWLAHATDLTAIPAKEFAHKRAFLCKNIMIEVILLEPTEKGEYLTHFFNGPYQLTWPEDCLKTLRVSEHIVPVASEQALQLYRQQHHLVVEAYQAYLQQVSSF